MVSRNGGISNVGGEARDYAHTELNLKGRLVQQSQPHASSFMHGTNMSRVAASSEIKGSRCEVNRVTDSTRAVGA